MYLQIRDGFRKGTEVQRASALLGIGRLVFFDHYLQAIEWCFGEDELDVCGRGRIPGGPPGLADAAGWAADAQRFQDALVQAELVTVEGLISILRGYEKRYLQVFRKRDWDRNRKRREAEERRRLEAEALARHSGVPVDSAAESKVESAPASNGLSAAGAPRARAPRAKCALPPDETHPQPIFRTESAAESSADSRDKMEEEEVKNRAAENFSASSSSSVSGTSSRARANAALRLVSSQSDDEWLREQLGPAAVELGGLPDDAVAAYRGFWTDPGLRMPQHLRTARRFAGTESLWRGRLEVAITRRRVDEAKAAAENARRAVEAARLAQPPSCYPCAACPAETPIDGMHGLGDGRLVCGECHAVAMAELGPEARFNPAALAAWADRENAEDAAS